MQTPKPEDVTLIETPLYECLLLSSDPIDIYYGVNNSMQATCLACLS